MGVNIAWTPRWRTAHGGFWSLPAPPHPTSTPCPWGQNVSGLIAIWDDFSLWTCPFPVGDMDRPIPIGDMDRPLSSWRYGPALFPHLLSPISPSVMHFKATRCIYVCCETGMPSWAHGDTFSVSILEHHFCPSCPQTEVCKLSIIDAPWTPSPLAVSSLYHHPHQFPQLTSLRKLLWTPC